MKQTLLIASAAVVTSIVIWGWCRAQAEGLREENRQLLHTSQEVEQLRAENNDLSDLRSAADANSSATPEFSQTDLFRLRNEVALARANAPDLDHLRSEKQRLENELNTIQTQRFEEMDGYTPREQWVDAGFATPEATVLTYFASISQGNSERILQCLMQKQADQLMKTLQNDPVGRDRVIKELRDATDTQGYRITTRETGNDGRVTLGLQAVLGGAILEMVLQQEGAEWKIERPFRPYPWSR